MIFKKGSIGKIAKINGIGLYNYIKNRSNSISSTVSTMNEDQSKNNNDFDKTISRKPQDEIISGDMKEETVNFIRKNINEVSLSTVKSTHMLPSKVRPARNIHFNSGMNNPLISNTAKLNGPIFSTKLPYGNNANTITNDNNNPFSLTSTTNSIPIICKPPEYNNKALSISKIKSPIIPNKNNDIIQNNNNNTEPNNSKEQNSSKEIRRNSMNDPNINIYSNNPSSSISSSSKRFKMQKNASMDIFHNIRKGGIDINKDIIIIEDLILLEDKYLDIIFSIKQKKSSLSECFEWWTYYFDSSLHGEKYDEFFYDTSSKVVIHSANNLELFAVLFCYYVSEDVSSCKKYNESLYSIFTKLHINYLYICFNILSQQESQQENDSDSSDDEDIWYRKMSQYVNRELINKAQCDITNVSENNIVNAIKQNSKLIVESIKAILSNYSNHEIFNSLVYYFSNLTKVTNNHLREFFREEVYNAYMRETNQTKKVLHINHRKSKSMMTITEIKTPYIRTKRTKPYTLVLDLDETLISTRTFNDFDGVVIFRPGLIEFLSTLRNYYELVSFTAASQDYADSVLEMIEEKQKYFDHRLYQFHTVQNNKEYIKDISRLGRDLSTIIIVDNMPHTFKLQKANGILIKSFYGDKKNDSALNGLLPILIKIAKDKGDVRKSIQKYRNELMNKVTSNLEYLNEFE